MGQTIEISVPDGVIQALGAEPQDLPRRSLEIMVAHLYRTGCLTHSQAGASLGLNRWETDGFLKAAKAFRENHLEELEKDFVTIRKFQR